MNLSKLGRSIFDRIIDSIRSIRMRKATTWITTIAMMLSIFSVMFPAVAAEAPPAVSVQILSPFEYLEPSPTNNANDKDGYPPQTSSADVEEGLIQAEIIITSTINDPVAELLDDNADAIDDLTIDDDNPRDLDLLDGVDDDALAPGTYYVYWNLDKTGYVPVNTTHGAAYNGSNSASISVVGDIEYYTVKLSQSGSSPVYSPQFTITMQNSASIKQNDLDWLQTAPDQVFAETGDIFSVRTLYHQNSANGLQHLISQVYDVGDCIRLLNISIYYYDNFHPGNISAGVPAGWTTAHFNTMELGPAQLTTTDNRDHWVMEYTFEVISDEFSFLIPYTQTIKKGSTWKVDTGYEGFQSWVPGGVNPANLTIEKYFSGNYPDGIVSGPNPPVVGYETVYEINITVDNIGGDRAINVLVTDTIPLDNVTWENTYTASKGTLTYYNATGYFEWEIGTLAKNTSETLSFQVSVTPTEADIGYRILLNTGAYVQGTSEFSQQPVEDGPTPPLQTEPVIAGAPSFALSKTATESTAYPGGVIHYEIVVNNTSSATAAEVWVNDTMPNDTTFESCSPPYDSLSGNLIKWHFINFTTGAKTIYLNVTASTSLNDGATLNNTVELTFSDQMDNWYPPQYDWVETDIIAPIMTVDKVADQSTADPGDIITYTIYYSNTGSGTASEAWVNDTIPEFTTYYSSNPTYTSKSGNVYSWYLTNVAPGNYSIELKLKVDIGTPDGTILSNGVELTYKTPPGEEEEEEDEENVTVTAPVMTISKVADLYLADPGDEITYTITYENTGNGTAKNVWVNDTIPADTTFVSATAGYSVSGNTYSWHFTDVAPGSYNITLVVKVDVGTADGTSLENNVTLDYTDANGNQPYDTQWDTTTTTVTAPIMTISKEADMSTANPGDLITYTIYYENTGTGVAGHVWINDTIPSYTTYNSSTPAYDSVSGDTYTWHFTDVAPGSYNITLKVTVDVGTPDDVDLIDNVTLEYTDANGNQPYELQWDTVIVTVTAPIMTISKTANVANADPGDLIIYNITYENTGSGNAQDVWVNDTIDPETTYESSDPEYTSVSGDTYTWHFTDVAPGIYYIELTVKVDIGTADGTTLENDVELEYTDANGNQPYDEESDNVTVTVTAPIMTISKVVDASLANPGDELTYTITYENTGTGNAAHVWVNDTIPADTTFVSATAGYSVSGDTYSWHFTDVAPGSYNITITVKVDVGTPDQTVLTNDVTLEYTDANGNQPYTTEEDSATTTVAAPDFTFSKVANVGSADPGDIVMYTLTYTNTGTGVAKDVWVNDTIPTDVTFINCTPDYTSVSGNTYTWHFTNVGTGANYIYINVKVDVNTADGTDLVNDATLDYTDANGNQPYTTLEDSVTVTVTAPVMTISKTADKSTANPGDEITYTITYENTGTGNAAHVWVNDTIPADTTFVSATAGYSVSGNTYSWHLTDVAPGSDDITITVKVDVGIQDQTVLTNNVTLDYTDANGNQPYDSQWDTATTTATAPIMSISKDVDLSTANPGDELNYTITYENTGTGDAKNVWVNDTIPADTTFVSATEGYSVSGDTYSWHFTDVAPGSYDITLIVKVDVGTANDVVLTNNVTLDYTDANGNQPYATQWDTATTTVTAPIMTIDKVADVSLADPDDTITYTITYENTGTGDAKNVWVNDTIPADTTFVSATGSYSVSGDTYQWHFTDVAPGSYNITITVKVDVGTADGASLVNNVTLDYTDANGNQPYDTQWDTATTTVTAPIMTIDKDVDLTEANPGDELNYTITYENTGTGNAAHVWINDTIPADTTFVSANPAYTSVSGDTYTWHFTDVAPGSYDITLIVKVDIGTPDQTKLTNNVTLEYTDANGNQPYAIQWDTTITTVTAPIMTIDKDVDLSTANPGDELTYTIIYENTGTGTAAHVWVNDTIPADTTFVSATGSYSVSGDTYSWHFTGVGTGTYYINITVKVDVGTPDQTVLTNNATLDYTDANSNQPYATQWDTTTTTVTAPIMTIDKEVDLSEANPGDELNYTITYENTGTGNAAHVWINDTIPADTTFVSANPAYTSVSGDTYTWHFTDVAPGSYDITLIVKVDVGTQDQADLTNNVTLDYTDANSNQPYDTQWDTTTTTATAPIMTIGKTADKSTANPGDEITYTIKYENTGTGDAKNVWVNDTIPADTTFVSATGSYSVSGDTYSWHITNVGTGVYYITLKVKVDIGTPDQTVLTNNVTLDYTDANGNQPYATQWDTETTTVTAPIISIDKTVDLTQANPDDDLTYTINYQNTGTGNAKHVWVNDTIPADTTFVSATGSYSVSGDTYSWHFTDVAPGNYSIIITVKVDIGTPDQTALVNNATLDYTDANGNQYAHQWDTATTIVTAPIMSIDKDVDLTTANPGDDLTYTITYVNTGTGTAAHVWVNDTIPADTTFVSSNPMYTSVSGDTYTWHFTGVGTGTYYINITVKVDVGTPDQTVLTNNATLDYTDANSNQPYATQWDTATTTVTAPIMTIDKVADVTVADPDDTITYTITYENTGTGTAAHVYVNDTIPADTTFVSATANYSVSGDTYMWHFTNVGTGTYYITIIVRVDIATPDQTILTNNATLDYTDANGNQPYAHQWDTATTTVTAPILNIEKDADLSQANPGDIITYTITYSNTGTGNAANVYIKDTIPSDTTYVSSSPIYTSVTGNTYTWHFTNVTPGNYSIELKVRVNVGTPDKIVLDNYVTMDYSDANDNYYPQINDTATTTVTAPIMTIEKVVDLTTANPGDDLTYNITYKNTGTGVAGHVWINDTIPADTTFVSATGSYSVSGDTYSWHLTNVGAGTYYIIITVKVDIGTADQTVLTNNVTLDYTDANGNQPYAMQWDTASTTVTAPIMSITKVVDLTTANPDDELTYTITYKNTGNGTAAHVWINDTIPADTTFVSATGSYSVSGDTYSWHFTNVGTGTYYITIKVKVDIGTPDQTILTNNVTLEYTDANGNQPYAMQWDTASTTVTAPIMSITKSVDLSTANPGDVITYTITYINSGTGTAGYVWVNDTIPADTTYVSSNPGYTSVSGDTYSWYIPNVGTGNYTIILKVRVDVGTHDQTVLTNNVTLDYADANNNWPYDTEWDTATTTVTAPVMSIEKVVDAANADPGDTLTYTITYKNTGSGVAAHVYVNDTIPTDTTFVSATGSYTVSGNTYSWHFTNVGTGTYYINITVKVNVGTPDKTILVNNVTLEYTDANNNQPYALQWDTATTTVTAPIMTIDKDVDLSTANPGDELTYTITIKNDGTGTAGKVWINDTLPSDVTLVSVGFTGFAPSFFSVTGNVYRWYFLNVGTGTYYITIKVKVDVGTADKTVLTNNVTMDYTDANGNQPYATQWDTATTIVTAPVMSIDKVADNLTADPDDLITYTITYKNTGTGVAAHVWVNDTIPADTTLVWATAGYSVSGNTYSWYFTNVGTGTYYITIIVRVDAYTPDKTVLTNNVTLDYTDANGNQPYATQWDTATSVVTAPVMTNTKVANASFADPGDLINYTITIQNTGTGVAGLVTVVDTIPADMTYVSTSPTYFSKVGNTITWRFLLFGTGSQNINLTVRVNVGTADKTVLVNNVTLDYTDANANPYPQSWDTATTTVTAPVMSMYKVVDQSTADPGDVLTYTITYLNTGTGVAGLVTIKDTIPADTTLVWATAGYTVSGDTYTWLIPNVGTGTYYIIIKVKVDVGTPDKTVLLNNATLDYTDANNNPYPQSWDTATTTVTAPIMSIEKVVDNATADPGDELVYTITYKNTGTGVAGHVWVNDTIPADTTLVWATAGYTISGDTLSWHFTNVGTGTYYITIKVIVDVGTPDRTVLLNNVTLDYTDANGNQPYATQWDTATTNVTAPVMNITKDAGDVEINVYVIADFRLRIAGEKWHDVRLTLYDGNQTVAFASITRYPGDPDDQAVTIYDVKINLLSGSFRAVIEYTPFDDPINGQWWGADPCWLILTFEDNSSVRLKHTFNVRHEDTWIWEVDDFMPYLGKAPITYEVIVPYTITYNNTGTGIAAHVWVNDTIPAGTTLIYASPNYTSVNGTTYTWYFTDVGTGTYYIDIVVMKVIKYKPPNKMILNLTNYVTLEYTDANGNLYPPKHANATVTVHIPVMRVYKDVDPGYGTLGSYLTVTLTVYTPLNMTTVKDYLPIGLNYTGNALDDDFDGLVDEEALDGFDNDGDGLIDEDLGNFRLDGAAITGGLTYSGHVLTFNAVPAGMHTITFEIVFVWNSTEDNITTNLAVVLYNNIVQDKDTADIIFFAPNTSPNAVISQPDDGSQFFEDVPIQFKGEESFDINDDNLTYHWDFGDGQTSDAMNPLHAFLDPGVYTVTLTVTDEYSESGQAQIQLTIIQSGPVAFIYKPFKLEWNIGQKITFIGLANYIGNPTNLEYEWQFGDGNYAFGSITKYSYAISGDYEVTLIVRDQDGDYDAVNITLTIKSKQGKPPQAPPAKEPPEDPPDDPPIIPPETGGAPPAPFTEDDDEPIPPEVPQAPQKPTSTNEMNNYEWTPDEQVLTPPGEQESPSSTSPEATAPFEMIQKPAKQVPLFDPDAKQFFSDSDESFVEQLVGHALEIVVGGSFIAGTFIMEVVITGKENEGEEDSSGEDEEPESEDEE